MRTRVGPAAKPEADWTALDRLSGLGTASCIDEPPPKPGFVRICEDRAARAGLGGQTLRCDVGDVFGRGPRTRACSVLCFILSEAASTLLEFRASTLAGSRRHWRMFRPRVSCRTRETKPEWRGRRRRASSARRCAQVEASEIGASQRQRCQLDDGRRCVRVLRPAAQRGVDALRRETPLSSPHRVNRDLGQLARAVSTDNERIGVSRRVPRTVFRLLSASTSARAAHGCRVARRCGLS